jgi:hypothetical protein
LTPPTRRSWRSSRDSRSATWWYSQRVPEGKTAKNRVHLDVRVADRSVRGPERDKLVTAKVAALEAAGGTVAWITDDERGKTTVMRDPEGNEFCVA